MGLLKSLPFGISIRRKKDERSTKAKAELSPFMRLPTEIRLMIFDLLLDDCGIKTFKFETESVGLYNLRKQKWRKPLHRRTSYREHWFDNSMRHGKVLTMYRLDPRLAVTLYPSILAVNRQIYNEASAILYRNRGVDFGTNLEAMQPFFKDLTPCNRKLIEQISLHKQSDVQARDRRDYTRGFDMEPWANACSYIAEHLRVQKLVLSVSCMCYMLTEQDMFPQKLGGLTASQFKAMAETKGSMVWVRKLFKIKGLREIEVIPTVHTDFRQQYKQSTREDIYVWNSIATGLKEYLQSEMLTPSAA